MGLRLVYFERLGPLLVLFSKFVRNIRNVRNKLIAITLAGIFMIEISASSQLHRLPKLY